MTDVITKLSTTTEQLTNELAEARKTVRHWQYELGVAQAASDRQSEQAKVTIDKQRQLAQEVNLLREEKEASSFKSYEKNGEVTRLNEEVQDLEDQIAELQDQRRRVAATEARRVGATEAQRQALTVEDRRTSRDGTRASMAGKRANTGTF